MTVSTLLLLVLLILSSGFLSGSETALFSLSPWRVRSFKQEGSRKKRIVAKLLDKPRDLLVTILMVNVAVNLGIQNVVSSMFGVYSGWLLTVGVPLFLTLVFGEALPKAIAISYNTAISLRVSPVIYFLRWFLGPIRICFTAVASFVSRYLFFFLKQEKEISLDELKHALKASHKQGLLSVDEAKLIRGALDVEEMIVKELMRPRPDILTYDISEPLDKLLMLFIDEECSRLPVIEGDLDHVLGMITSDIYFLHHNRIKTSDDLRPYLKEVLFVPETVSARHLLSQFNRAGETIALVVDEYGQISGLVSKEDIVEIVIGEIADRRDEKVLFTRQSDDVIICSGKLEVSKLEELFDVDLLNTSNAVTVGGWLIEELGEIPQSSVKHVSYNLLFHVLSATPVKISRLYIRRLNAPKKKMGEPHA